MIIKRKSFSLIKRFKSGIKGAFQQPRIAYAAGAIGGSILSFIPALIARIFGKKAFLITEALGAGVGLGFVMYMGYKYAVDKYDYNKKLEEDPKFREKVEKENRDELVKYVSNKKNYSLPNSRDIIKTFHKIEKDLGVSYKEDFYKYIKYYESFYKKYNNKWYDVLLKNGSSMQDLDIEFNYIFPEPIFEYDRATIDITEARSLGDDIEVGLVAGSLEHSDHGYLFYHFEDKTYSFDLGFGYDSKSIAESIIKRCNDYRDFYQVDRTDEAYLTIVKIHSEIVDEFIRGLKRL